jgi:hypothetical protein
MMIKDDQFKNHLNLARMGNWQFNGLPAYLLLIFEENEEKISSLIPRDSLIRDIFRDIFERIFYSSPASLNVETDFLMNSSLLNLHLCSLDVESHHSWGRKDVMLFAVNLKALKREITWFFQRDNEQRLQGQRTLHFLSLEQRERERERERESRSTTSQVKKWITITNESQETFLFLLIYCC